MIESLQEDKQRLRLNPKREAGLQKGETSPVQQQSLVHVSERASVKQLNGPIGKLQSVLDVESDEHSGESEDEGHNASQKAEGSTTISSTIGIKNGSLKSGQIQW